MAKHHFNKEVAVLVGVNAAVLFENISYWCEKNQANGTHLYDGEHWTYNSIKAFEELFPYLSTRQIKTALDKLHELKLIGFGEYNNNPYDRTRWYCDFTQKQGLNAFLSSMRKCQMESAEMSNVEEYKTSPSITDINTDVNTDSKPFTELKNSVDENQKNLFGIEEVKTPVKTKKVKKEKPMTLRQKVIDFWLKEFHPGWSFNSTDGKKIDLIIKKINKTLSINNQVCSEDKILYFFKIFCLNLPAFYKTKNLSVLESNYDTIIDEIKYQKNGKQSSTEDRQFAFGFYKRSSAANSSNNS